MVDYVCGVVCEWHLEEAPVLAGVADDLHGRRLLLGLELLHVDHREGERAAGSCHLSLVSPSPSLWLSCVLLSKLMMSMCADRAGEWCPIYRRRTARVKAALS